tara:strand:- start:96 stop:758 length:663 start_codon:yes stop_codon:yes gene_type:complete
MISIMQPHYLPWLGYFYLIYKSKNLVFLDDVKFQYQSWQHRNYILSNNKPILLTAPIDNMTKNNKIVNVKFRSELFREKHLKTIHQVYCKTKYFETFFPILEDIYSFKTENISEFNQNFIMKISKLSNINANFYKSSQMQISSPGQDKIIEICKKLNLKTYISTPGSSAYLSEKKFLDENIYLEYMDYSKIESKKKDDKNLSVIDFIFREGFNLKKIFDS